MTSPPPPTQKNFIKLSPSIHTFKKIKRVLNDKDHKDPTNNIIYHYVKGFPKMDGSPRIYNLDDEMDVYLLRTIIGMSLPPSRAEPLDPEAEERRVQGLGRATGRRRRHKSKSKSSRRKSRRNSRHNRRKKSKSHKKKHSSGGKKSRKLRKPRRKPRSCSIMGGGSQGYAFNGKINNMALATPMPRTSYNTCES